MTRSRHIVFVNEFYHPDICASAAVLSDRLPRLCRLMPQHRFTVIAGNRAWDEPDRVYASEEEHQGVRIIRVGRPPVGTRNILRRGMGFFAFGMHAARAAKRLRPIDLVIGSTAPPHGGGIAGRMARAVRCPYIYTVFDLYPDLATSLGRVSNRSPIHQAWLTMDCRWMRKAARVVCIADGINRRIVQTRGLLPGKVATIHDGFDPARLKPPEFVQGADSSGKPRAPNGFGREFNPGGRFVVQYAGNMGLSHPFETIMAAASRLSMDETVQFQFIGAGPHRAYIAERLPANGVLIDYQPAERLGEILDAADVCLISQHDDMFDKALPYKIYGIFAAAKPAIFIGNVKSEIATWLREQEAGVTVAHGDVDALCDAISGLKRDPAAGERMGAAGRRLLEEKLHAETSATKWAGVIGEVLRSRDRR
ncbi:MAG TPA: glycosyltransferase family 4 protein [Phycisphaerae bacterium]|nr:glycosyltransferase family 4 protein [Phycisphaerae bacterium]